MALSDIKLAFAIHTKKGGVKTGEEAQVHVMFDSIAEAKQFIDLYHSLIGTDLNIQVEEYGATT
jgi:hypothetical protein